MLRVLLVVILILTSVCSVKRYMDYRKSTDGYIRDRIVLLHNAEGASCTGVQIIAPSKKVYTLTAAHCKDLADAQGHILAKTEQGEEKILDFIEEDSKSDLMLLTSVDSTGILVAKNTTDHEHVHAITHGMGRPSFRTDGELLEVAEVTFPVYEIKDYGLFIKCTGSTKNTILIEITGQMVCAVDMDQMLSTTPIMPGSSGGPLLDASGSLVGIAMSTFYSFVTLDDIHQFLSDK